MKTYSPSTPELVEQLRKWLKTKRKLAAKTPLFLISRCVPGGIERKTSKMIERDLMAARDKWLEEAKTEEEQEERLKSDFLCYCNHDGRFADFHSLRHLFITRLGKAGHRPQDGPNPGPALRHPADDGDLLARDDAGADGGD